MRLVHYDPEESVHQHYRLPRSGTVGLAEQHLVPQSGFPARQGPLIEPWVSEHLDNEWERYHKSKFQQGGFFDGDAHQAKFDEHDNYGREVMSHMKVFKTFPTEYLGDIHGQGFLNQFATGHTGGSEEFSPGSQRDRFETEHFGLPAFGEPDFQANRPTYGFLATEIDMGGPHRYYGDVTAEFHDHVRPHITFCLGDSLNNAYDGRQTSSALTAPHPATFIHNSPGHNGLRDHLDDHMSLGMSPENAAWHIDNDTQETDGYIEAQFHRNVGFPDVKTFHINARNTKAMEYFDKHNLPYQVH